jgi:hypothetical protein
MIGYSNETLATLPDLAAGAEVRCPRCRQPHVVLDSEPPGLLSIHCPLSEGFIESETFLVGVGGKDVRGVQPDLSRDRPPVALCDECWSHGANPEHEPNRMVDADEAACGVCGEPTRSGIFVLAYVAEFVREARGL